MEAVNCPRCGKLFTRIKSPICPSCAKEDDQTFLKVREFVSDNENCTLSELSNGTGVSQKSILRYIREGRLETSNGMHGDVRCRICGQPISKGQYCDACIIKINQNIYDMFSKTNEDHIENAIMHISDTAKK